MHIQVDACLINYHVQLEGTRKKEAETEEAGKGRADTPSLGQLCTEPLAHHSSIHPMRILPYAAAFAPSHLPILTGRY